MINSVTSFQLRVQFIKPKWHYFFCQLLISYKIRNNKHLYSPAHVIIELLNPNTFIIELERGNCLQNVDIYLLAYLFVRPLITFQASKLNLRCRCDTTNWWASSKSGDTNLQQKQKLFYITKYLSNYKRFDRSKNVSFIALEY